MVPSVLNLNFWKTNSIAIIKICVTKYTAKLDKELSKLDVHNTEFSQTFMYKVIIDLIEDWKT